MGLICYLNALILNSYLIVVIHVSNITVVSVSEELRLTALSVRSGVYQSQLLVLQSCVMAQL